MKCPKCNAQNAENDKFCAECGAQLVEPKKEECEEPPTDKAPSADKNASAPNPPTTSDGASAPKPPASSDGASAPKPPSASDGASAAKAAAEEKVNALIERFKSLSQRQKMYVGGGFAAVVVVIVALVMVVGAGPSDSVVENYLRSQTYSLPQSSSTTLTVESVKITGKSKMEGGKELMSFFGLAGTTYYEYSVEVKAAGNGVEMDATYDSVDVGKSQKTNEWKVIGGASSWSGKKTYRAIAGMDSKKVDDAIAAFNNGNMTSNLISNALSTATVKNPTNYSLGSVYCRGAKAEIANEVFDEAAQTDTFSIGVSVDNAFYSASGTVTLVYQFSDGSWGLKTSECDEKAGDVSFDNLVGTWTGSFNKQKIYPVGKCNGATGQPFKIVIDSVDSSTLEIKGTVAGLLHSHKDFSGIQASTDGDHLVSDQPFTMTCTERSVHTSGSFWQGQYVGEYKSDATDDGQMKLWLEFSPDDSDDGDKLNAVLITTVKGNYFDPEWGDSYTLTKAE